MRLGFSEWFTLVFSQTFTSVFSKLWRHGEHVLFLNSFIYSTYYQLFEADFDVFNKKMLKCIGLQRNTVVNEPPVGRTVKLGAVYMKPGRLSLRREFTPVPSFGSAFVYMMPPKNVMWSESHRRGFTPVATQERKSPRSHVNSPLESR